MASRQDGSADFIVRWCPSAASANPCPQRTTDTRAAIPEANAVRVPPKALLRSSTACGTELWRTSNQFL